MPHRTILTLGVLAALLVPGAAQGCGDCDGNGAWVTILDALVGAQLAAGLQSPTPTQARVCDVDGSSTITILDALTMAQSAAALPVTLRCPSTPPAATACTAPPTASATVLIDYTLSDAESDPADLELEVSTDGGATFQPATPGAGGDGVMALVTSPAGVAHVVAWDSSVDLPGLVATARVRITPRDGAGIGASCTTADVTIDNSPPGSTALVLWDSTGTVSFGMMAGTELATDLTSDGFTVTLLDQLPASLLPFDVIYDLRFTLTPSVADLAAFRGFLALGRGLAMATGWSTSNPRAQAIAVWMTSDLGAGTVVLTQTGSTGHLVTPSAGHSLWTTPNAIAGLDVLDSNCTHVITDPGNGTHFIGNSTVHIGAFWDSGELTLVPGGRVVQLCYANFVMLTNAIGEQVLENISTFLLP